MHTFRERESRCIVTGIEGRLLFHPTLVSTNLNSFERAHSLPPRITPVTAMLLDLWKRMSLSTCLKPPTLWPWHGQTIYPHVSYTADCALVEALVFLISSFLYFCCVLTCRKSTTTVSILKKTTHQSFETLATHCLYPCPLGTQWVCHTWLHLGAQCTLIRALPVHLGKFKGGHGIWYSV